VRIRALDSGDGIKGVLAKIVLRLMLGLRKPKQIHGSVLAGVVEEAGSETTRFKVGDEIYAMTGLSFGAFADYCALSDKRAMALKPKTAGFEEASALPFGGNTALYF
jgi:NADPH:quinone reductase-like Zn-dependent oxidoreductase